MIRRLLLHLIGNAAALYFISIYLHGDFFVTGGVQGYFIAALIFGLINTLVKPILKLLSLPLMLMTMGLFSLVLNVLILWLVKYVLEVLAFQGVSIYVAHLPAFFYAGLLLAVANFFIGWLTEK